MKKIFLYLLFFIGLGTFGILFFVFKTHSLAKIENAKALTKIHLNQIDCLIIFTGDTGRIPLGLQMANTHKIPKIFITGVYNRNTLPIILRKNAHLLELPQLQRPKNQSQWIEIDYSAQNTIGNVLSTLQFLRKEKLYKKIIIVSSDYHLYRIKFIMQKLRLYQDDFQFYYMPVQTIATNFRSLKLICLEIIKIFNAQGIFLFWENDK